MLSCVLGAVTMRVMGINVSSRPPRSNVCELKARCFVAPGQQGAVITIVVTKDEWNRASRKLNAEMP